MKFTVGSVAMAALLALANAKPLITNSVMDPVAGETFVITWSNAAGPVKLTLKNGPETALKTVTVVGTGLSGNSFSWNVPENLAPGTYAIEIDDGTEPNYSAPFPLEGSGTASTSQAPASTSRPTGSTTSAPTPTTSSTSTSTTSRSTTTPGGSQNTNVPGAAGRVASPLALVLVTIAAMVYFN